MLSAYAASSEHPVIQRIIYNAGMVKTTKKRRLFAWIACLAILLNAFVPVVSHALSLGSPAAQLEVCTAMGIEMVMVPDQGHDDGAASDKLLKSLTHCGYCATHAGSFGLPPQPIVVFALDLQRDTFPPLYYLAPDPLFTWSLAQPRAPPAAA